MLIIANALLLSHAVTIQESDIYMSTLRRAICPNKDNKNSFHNPVFVETLSMTCYQQSGCSGTIMIILSTVFMNLKIIIINLNIFDYKL